MGVGFYLTGQIETTQRLITARTLSQKVAEWLAANGGEPFLNATADESDENHCRLYLNFHPAAESIDLSITSSGQIVASAKTSTVGPGYHIYLCDLLGHMGDELRIAWDPPSDDGDTGDETGYFHNGDKEAVKAEMLAWLGGNANVVLEQMQGDFDGFMVCMPMTHHYEYQGSVITPLGRRSVEWFRSVVDDPVRGIDFFAWWSPGINAEFYRGRALTRMWTEARWRAPLSEAEAECLRQIHSDLKQAFEFDPQCDLPFREWVEILGYLDDADGGIDQDHSLLPVLEKRANNASGPQIGYRRDDVTVQLMSGWSIKIPGEMAEEWSENGETWSAWDGRRTILVQLAVIWER